MTKENTQREDIAVLKEQVNSILTNHLPHLQAQIGEFQKLYFDNHRMLQDTVESIRRQQSYWSGGLAVVIVIVDIVLKFVK